PGGPFAEAVRTMFRRMKIGEDAAHWMAVLGMDQYAHALTARLPSAVLVEQESEIAAAREAGRLPVLAPYRWVRTADPLPHSWEVTSDSIAARLAGVLGARPIVLIKPAGGDPPKPLDPFFLRTPPAGRVRRGDPVAHRRGVEQHEHACILGHSVEQHARRADLHRQLEQRAGPEAVGARPIGVGDQDHPRPLACAAACRRRAPVRLR